VDTDSLLVVANALTQATNDKQQVVPMLEQLQALPPDLGRVKRLLADSGYASEDNVNACAQANIQPLIALAAKPIMARRLIASPSRCPCPVSRRRWWPCGIDCRRGAGASCMRCANARSSRCSD